MTRSPAIDAELCAFYRASEQVSYAAKHRRSARFCEEDWLRGHCDPGDDLVALMTARAHWAAAATWALAYLLDGEGA